jgi:hypothetical protein
LGHWRAKRKGNRKGLRGLAADRFVIGGPRR